MNKAYNPVKWLNHETPINEVNLNRMGDALNTVDDRVCNHDRVLSGFSASVNQALEASKTAVSASASAVESAEKAEEALKNAEAVVGVGIATKDKAGLVKADDVHIASDGTLKFIEKTTSTTLPNSHKGRLLIEEIGGVSEQESTTGAQLFDVNKAISLGSAAVNIKSIDNIIMLTTILEGTYRQTQVIPIDVQYIAGNTFTVSVGEITGDSSSPPYITLRYLDSNGAIVTGTFDEGVVHSNESVTYTIKEIEGAAKIGVILLANAGTSVAVGTTATFKDFMVNAGATTLPWEPYTGGQASPSPDYPQEIKTVKGKNLLDCRGLTEYTSNGVTFTPVYDSNGNLLYVEANGTPTITTIYSVGNMTLNANQEYTLNGCPSIGSDSSFRIDIRPTSDTVSTVYDSDHGYGATFAYAKKEEVSVFIRIANSYTATNLRFYPMIRPASVVDSTYVPYGLLRVKTIDLYNLVRFKDVNYTNLGITVNVKDGVITATGTPTVSEGNVFTRFSDDIDLQLLTVGKHYVTNATLIVKRKNGAEQYVDGVTYTADIESIKLYVQKNVSNYVSGEAIKPMLNEGTIVKDWRPYTESSITLSSPIELCGIGDAQDVIDVENGVIRRRIKKVVFDGSSDEVWITYGIGSANAIFMYNTLDIARKEGFCSHFVEAPISSGNTNIGFSCTSATKSIRFRPNNAETWTMESWKAWLAENPVTVLYHFTDEKVRTEALPIADQIALNSLATYDGATYLEWDCYLEPTFSGKYGTSEVGGYTLEGLLTGRNAEIQAKADAERITALETALINNV